MVVDQHDASVTNPPNGSSARTWCRPGSEQLQGPPISSARCRIDTRPSPGPRCAGQSVAVVGDLEDQAPGRPRRGQGTRRARVAHRVGQRLGRDPVAGDVDCRRQPRRTSTPAVRSSPASTSVRPASAGRSRGPRSSSAGGRRSSLMPRRSSTAPATPEAADPAAARAWGPPPGPERTRPAGGARRGRRPHRREGRVAAGGAPPRGRTPALPASAAAGRPGSGPRSSARPGRRPSRAAPRPAGRARSRRAGARRAGSRRSRHGGRGAAPPGCPWGSRPRRPGRRRGPARARGSAWPRRRESTMPRQTWPGTSERSRPARSPEDSRASTTSGSPRSP